MFFDGRVIKMSTQINFSSESVYFGVCGGDKWWLNVWKIPLSNMSGSQPGLSFREEAFS